MIKHSFVAAAIAALAFFLNANMTLAQTDQSSPADPSVFKRPGTTADPGTTTDPTNGTSDPSSTSGTAPKGPRQPPRDHGSGEQDWAQVQADFQQLANDWQAGNFDQCWLDFEQLIQDRQQYCYDYSLALAAATEVPDSAKAKY